MRRNGVITLTVIASALCMLAVTVDAQRGRRGRRGRGGQATAQAAAAPRSAAIAQSLGELRWGMEPRAVHGHFATEIQETYRQRLSKVTGAIEEDRLRHDQADELRRLRESYVRFRGTRTGWDLSFLRGEFTHGNNESMMVVRDGNSQNFYFFIGGRLWKWYKAFDASVFDGQSFEQFAAAVQGRFGEAVERNGRLVEGGPQQRWLEWQDATTRLRAIDQTRFYGFYCLVFEDKATLNRIDTLRTHTIETGQSGSHALVDAVTQPEGGTPSSDHDANSDIVDRITGNIRRRPAAGEGQRPAQGGASGGAAAGGNSGGNSGGAAGSGTRRGRSDSLDLGDL